MIYVMATAPGTKIARRWTRALLAVALWLAVSYVAWYSALWLFGVPFGTLSGPAPEGLSGKVEQIWWTNVLIQLVLFVVVYNLLPWAWRRWFRGNHGEVAC